MFRHSFMNEFGICFIGAIYFCFVPYILTKTVSKWFSWGDRGGCLTSRKISSCVSFKIAAERGQDSEFNRVLCSAFITVKTVSLIASSVQHS